jgi:hypothetical protein
MIRKAGQITRRGKEPSRSFSILKKHFKCFEDVYLQV